MVKMQKTIPYWREELEKAPTEVKKMILSRIINKIVVYSNKGERNCSIEIELNIEIEEFLRLAEGRNKEPNDLHEQNIVKSGHIGLENTLCFKYSTPLSPKPKTALSYCCMKENPSPWRRCRR